MLKLRRNYRNKREKTTCFLVKSICSLKFSHEHDFHNMPSKKPRYLKFFNEKLKQKAKKKINISTLLVNPSQLTNDQCSRHIGTSQSICSADQLTGFYVTGTLVVVGLC